VRVLAGTDARLTEHGTISHEIGLLLAAGIDPHPALGASSWLGRAWLGLPLTEEGASGDLVAYREDRRTSPSTGRTRA
jgi:imidazolonepropionase-like amidohydrolase